MYQILYPMYRLLRKINGNTLPLILLSEPLYRPPSLLYSSRQQLNLVQPPCNGNHSPGKPVKLLAKRVNLLLNRVNLLLNLVQLLSNPIHGTPRDKHLPVIDKCPLTDTIQPMNTPVQPPPLPVATAATAGALAPAPVVPPWPALRGAPPSPAGSAVAILKAAGHPLRWQMLTVLAQSGPQTIAGLAKLLRCPYDIAMMHLRVLRRSGAVDTRQDADRRFLLYFLPPGVVRDTPEGERLLAYPYCLLRPGLAAPPAPAPPPPPVATAAEPDADQFFQIMP